MRDVGLGKKEIEAILEQKIGNDCDFTAGNIIGSMCTQPLDFVREVYAKYLHINVGDKGISPKTSDLEAELISLIGEIFHGSEITGNIVSGGTEANIIAMRLARKYRSDIKTPEIIASEEAHLSFEKLADLIGVKIIKAKLKDNYQLDINDVRSKINENTCGLIGIAGTTGLGFVDPIEELGELAAENDLYLHIDAAFGGFLLPFVGELSQSIPKWDFAVPGVTSICADPHKMGMSVIPGGSFLIRKNSHLEKLTFEIPYLAGGAYSHFNLLGTRPGASVIAFWATLNRLGRSGYEEIVARCVENAKYVSKKLESIDGIKPVTDPLLNVVALTTEDGSDITLLNEKLKRLDWHLGEFKEFNFLRIVCMPHVKKQDLDAFCRDLKTLL